MSLGYLLNKLDGLACPEGVVVLATTNNPQSLDPALLHRPSRFDRVWTFPMPAYAERLALLSRRGGASFGEAALAAAARRSGGFSMAYVQEVVVSALMTSIHDGVAPRDEHLLSSVERLRKQVRQADEGAARSPAVSALGFRNGEQVEP